MQEAQKEYKEEISNLNKSTAKLQENINSLDKERTGITNERKVIDQKEVKKERPMIEVLKKLDIELLELDSNVDHLNLNIKELNKKMKKEG